MEIQFLKEYADRENCGLSFVIDGQVIINTPDGFHKTVSLNYEDVGAILINSFSPEYVSGLSTVFRLINARKNSQKVTVIAPAGFLEKFNSYLSVFDLNFNQKDILAVFDIIEVDKNLQIEVEKYKINAIISAKTPKKLLFLVQSGAGKIAGFDCSNDAEERKFLAENADIVFAKPKQNENVIAGKQIISKPGKYVI